ncbi:DUF2059 domain-containing protein [Tabrizicola piscis]|uniref:DUF2059 domain-containing protein n=2 Tax=Tabrizicola piscis TaxID=2494374 RepID=A0A3S8U2S0_9RHOB|nr:DUF2059 domain-containing protein [Tabrizicola piscis]
MATPRFSMLLTRLLLVATLGLATPAVVPAVAQTTDATTPATASIVALGQALQLDALFAVLREEGIAYGQTLEDEMFPGGGGPQWASAVAKIYDAAALQTQFEAALQTELGDDPETLSTILAFFTSDLGKRVVGLEIEARRAFLDTATEEAARVAADNRFGARDPIVPLLRRFIEAGDLIEMNVAGSLSGNLAFMTGMTESGVYGDAMPQDQLMSDVWAQEDQIRDDTSAWLYAYLGLAYAPLAESDLQAYIEFMETPAGQRLNAALFTAFSEVFTGVSRDLGHAAGVAMLGTDI